MARLHFAGGTGTVTGSKYLVEGDSTRVLVDCGLFQGYKNLRRRNWDPPPFDIETLDAVILTHAHLDHSGFVPRLVKHGYRGVIYATAPTVDLCRILLPDSGRIQEEDADQANRRKSTRHDPALPLYAESDARKSLEQFQPVDFDQPVDVGPDLSFTCMPAGHILGASILTLTLNGTRLTFSGDLGRPGDPVMLAPRTGIETDYLVCESTYGNRTHGPEHPVERLSDAITRTAEREGIVLIPSFAVGRAQTVLYLIHTAMAQGKIPRLPVYLNSPMAESTTDLYLKYPDWHRLSETEVAGIENHVRFVRTVEESIALNSLRGPAIIVSASGMLTGGRVLHHLERLGPNRRNTLVFVGYQAGGTRGSRILNGEDQVKVYGKWVPIRCEVASIGDLSAHADADEIVGWLKSFPVAPRQTFITHGEPDPAEALRVRIQEELGWSAIAPAMGDVASLKNTAT